MRFQDDPNRQNRTIDESGREYNQRLIQRTQTIFSTLLDLLPSNYISAVQGPNYSTELKQVATELARIELSLEDVNSDRDFNLTRSDFLYSLIGYMALLHQRVPASVSQSDVQFRNFLLNLLAIYFQGSIPGAMQQSVDLFITSGTQVLENFLLTRQGASGFDISDEFGFQVDVIIPPGGGFPANTPDAEAGIRAILDIIRPAHTLFKFRYIFSDEYVPNDPVKKPVDASHWDLKDYHYEDIRRYWAGVRGRDRLGMKQNLPVVGEDHSIDF